MFEPHEWELLVARVGECAFELLSPTRCACCERPGMLVCRECLAALQRIDPATCCPRCGAPFGSLLCTECPPEPGPLGRCLAAVVFDERSSRCVRAYKDAGERALAGELAGIMLGAACRAEVEDPERFAGIVSGADAVTFVPATCAAYRRRGFDHMERIARAYAAGSGLVLEDALVKLGRADQRALTRSGRLDASAGAYEVVGEVEGKRLLLLDDVMTTGATIRSAAAALMRAGAARVDALAFARVWG